MAEEAKLLELLQAAAKEDLQHRAEALEAGWVEQAAALFTMLPGPPERAVGLALSVLSGMSESFKAKAAAPKSAEVASTPAVAAPAPPSPSPLRTFGARDLWPAAVPRLLSPNGRRLDGALCVVAATWT